MARLAVNPTRMELRHLKDRLKTAQRGHKLLKDKSDEMIRQFMNYVRQNKQLREEIEDDLRKALQKFMLAGAMRPVQQIEQALAMPSYKVDIVVSTKNVMGVDVPSISITPSASNELIPYNLVSTTSETDEAIITISKLIEKMLKLAEIEKICNMLANEIEKNRRRVNALEYVVIPQLEETIKYIIMKLDENERANLIRLMKVKTMIENR